MLTGDLLAYSRRHGRLIPRRLDPSDPALLAVAEALLELFRAHRNRRRGDLEEALAGFLPPGAAPKVVRGLGRILLDRCTFEVGGGTEPRELRAELFEGAAGAWRNQGAASLQTWRGELIARAGSARGLEPAEVTRNLYADIPANQLLTGMRPLTPERLLQRFNVAQVQGLLLRAERLTISVPEANPLRLRQLFRYLRFFGLLFEVNRRDGAEGEREQPGTRTIVVDGPLSLLESGNRYGLNLAQFFPALLLWPPPWRLSGELIPKPGRPAARLEVEPHPHLRSHYPDQGQWLPEEVRRFAEGFGALGSRWRVAPAEELITLPGNDFLIPDFLFRHRDTGARIHLEYLRYPVPAQVGRRLALLEAHGVTGYLLACRKVPALEELERSTERLFAFRRNLLPAQFRKFLDRFAGSAPAETGRESFP